MCLDLEIGRDGMKGVGMKWDGPGQTEESGRVQREAYQWQKRWQHRRSSPACCAPGTAPVGWAHSVHDTASGR